MTRSPLRTLMILTFPLVGLLGCGEGDAQNSNTVDGASPPPIVEVAGPEGPRYLYSRAAAR